MPRLPDWNDVGPAPGVSGARPVGSYDVSPYAQGAQALASGTQALGQGFDKAGTGFGRLAVGIERNNNATNKTLAQQHYEYTSANSDYLSQDLDLRTQFAQDPDYATAPQRYAEASAPLIDQAASSVSNPVMRADLVDKMTASAAEGLEGIRQSANAKFLDDATMSERARRADLFNKAAQAPDEASKVRAIDAANLGVDGLVSIGALTPADALAEKQDAARQFAVASLRNEPPKVRLAMLGGTDVADDSSPINLAGDASAGDASNPDGGTSDPAGNDQVDGQTAQNSGRPRIVVHPLQPPTGDTAGGAGSAGNMADFLDAQTRLELRREAEAELLREQQHQEAFAGLERYSVRNAIDDEAKSIAATGQATGDLTPDRVKAALGDDGITQWQNTRADAHAVFVNTHDFSTLPNAQIDERLAALSPDSDPRSQAIYDAVKVKADTQKQLRLVDPAQSVADDPVVKSALAARNDNDPNSVHATYAARIAAQDRAGIPKAQQTPITKAEALGLLAPLRDMKHGEEQTVVPRVTAQFQSLFGSDAERVFAFALGAQLNDADSGKAVAHAWTSQAGPGNTAPAITIHDTIDPADIRKLDLNRSRAAEFDKTYPAEGGSAAAAVLAEVDRRRAEMGLPARVSGSPDASATSTSGVDAFAGPRAGLPFGESARGANRGFTLLGGAITDAETYLAGDVQALEARLAATDSPYERKIIQSALEHKRQYLAGAEDNIYGDVAYKLSGFNPTVASTTGATVGALMSPENAFLAARAASAARSWLAVSRATLPANVGGMALTLAQRAPGAFAEWFLGKIGQLSRGEGIGLRDMLSQLPKDTPQLPAAAEDDESKAPAESGKEGDGDVEGPQPKPTVPAATEGPNSTAETAETPGSKLPAENAPAVPTERQQLETPTTAPEETADAPAANNITVPQKVIDTLQHIREKGFHPTWYVGGREYENSNGLLPQGGKYREYDVDLKPPKGTKRNKERLVIDSTSGRAWYTDDHYETNFVEIK